MLTSAPSGTVVIPDNFDLAYVSESPSLYEVVRSNRIRFAAMLRAYLHNTFGFQDASRAAFASASTLPIGFST